MLYREAGINWTWFYDIELIGNKAIIVDSFRVHKSYETPLAKEISFRSEKKYLIDKWRKDGGPGGIDGLKRNYKNKSKKEFVRIDGREYELSCT